MYKLKNLISLILVLAICLSFAMPIGATELTDASGTAQTPVVLTTEAATFSVTVPTGLPVNVSADGTVTVADNAKIINNSAGPVKVVDMSISAVENWTIAGYETDLRNALVDSNEIGMVINDCQTTGADAIDFDAANFTVMMATNDSTDDECPITYNAKVTPLSEAFSTNTVANIVFTVDWDKVEVLIIPEGGTYYVGVTSKVTGDYSGAIATYTSGDEFPASVSDADVYVYGDYEYRYNKGASSSSSSWYANNSQGWGVRVLDTTKTTYETILENINGMPITYMSSTFKDCANLTTSPKIPSTVKNMGYTFKNCKKLIDEGLPIIPSNVNSLEGAFDSCYSLKNLSNFVIPSSVIDMGYTFNDCLYLNISPIIPSSVTDMVRTFYGCQRLTTLPEGFEIPSGVKIMQQTFFGCTKLIAAPLIPNTVENLRETFYGCKSLTGTITINATLSDDLNASFNCFGNVDFDTQNLTIEGTCQLLDELGATGKNYCAECNGKCLNTH